MKKSIAILSCLLLFSCNKVVSSSLIGGDLISESEYNPFPSISSEEINSSYSSSEGLLNELFIGTFVEAYNNTYTITIDTEYNLEIKSEDASIKFTFVEQIISSSQVGSNDIYTAHFVHEDKYDLTIEYQGVTHYFVTINDGDYIEEFYDFFSDTAFDKVS